MGQLELAALIESELNTPARKIIYKNDIRDEIAHAKNGFYISLRRPLSKKVSPTDLGALDAINDTLQVLGTLDAKHYVPERP